MALQRILRFETLSARRALPSAVVVWPNIVRFPRGIFGFLRHRGGAALLMVSRVGLILRRSTVLPWRRITTIAAATPIWFANLVTLRGGDRPTLVFGFFFLDCPTLPTAAASSIIIGIPLRLKRISTSFSFFFCNIFSLFQYPRVPRRFLGLSPPLLFCAARPLIFLATLAFLCRAAIEAACRSAIADASSSPSFCAFPFAPFFSRAFVAPPPTCDSCRR